MRNTRYKDPMSLQEKVAAPTKLSSLAEDPQLHEYVINDFYLKGITTTKNKLLWIDV